MRALLPVQRPLLRRAADAARRDLRDVDVRVVWGFWVGVLADC